MECEEPVNCWKCGDDKSIDQKQKVYYYIGQQEDGRTAIKNERRTRKKIERFQIKQGFK